MSLSDIFSKKPIKCMYVCVYVCASRQWLEDAMKENDPSSVLLFLVGTKKDLSVGEFYEKIMKH